MRLTKKERQIMDNMAEAVARNPELKPVVVFLTWLSEKLDERLTELETRQANIWKKLLEVGVDQPKKG